jgi:hypothetical protein
VVKTSARQTKDMRSIPTLTQHKRKLPSEKGNRTQSKLLHTVLVTST